jgi:hypothetical protein
MLNRLCCSIVTLGIVLQSANANADPCTAYEWSWCGVVGCYYYTNITVTAGPTDCKKAGFVRSQATVTCSTNPTKPGPDGCNPNRTATTTKKYNLTGSITYDKWGSLSASYDSETTVVVECKTPNVTIGGLNCSESPLPPDQTCCKEAWETQQTTSKKIDVMCHYASSGGFWDFGECNGPYSSGNVPLCTYEGTLVEVIGSDCSDCTNLQQCYDYDASAVLDLC